MNKLLSVEFAVVVLLLVATIFIRVGVLNTSAVPEEPALSTEPSAESKPPEETTAPPSSDPTTEPEPTEPPESPIKLTFGEDFTLESRDYFVYDCAEENLMAISPDGLDEKVYPASVTKLYTAYVALQYLDPDTVVTLGREVYMVGEGSSLAGVKPKQRISVAELVEALLLPSGNDAAYGIAVAAAEAKTGDSSMDPEKALDYFVEMMNDTAQTLGMTGSHFANPDGYHDPDHYTSCADLITIAKLALSNDLIRTSAGKYERIIKFSNGETAVWDNTNALINPESQYYHADAIGLKTGHTSAAGFCVLTAFELEGEYIIIGTFGCQRPEDRFIDAVKLYELAAAAKTE